MNMNGCVHPLLHIFFFSLEAGIVREIEERKETHTVMFAGLQEKLKTAVAAVEAEAGASITDRFEPGLSEHVSLLCACAGFWAFKFSVDHLNLAYWVTNEKDDIDCFSPRGRSSPTPSGTELLERGEASWRRGGGGGATERSSLRVRRKKRTSVSVVCVCFYRYIR